MKNNELRLLVIDPLANEKEGHLYDDDLFWSKNLPQYVAKFGIRTSIGSINNISSALSLIHNAIPIDTKPIPYWFSKKSHQKLRLLILSLTIRTSNYKHILFQSFEEISTIFFKLFRPTCKVHIIVTNNLSEDRFLRNPKLHKILLKTVFKIVDTIFVHSQFEVDLLTNKYNINNEKVFIKPFHQFYAVDRFKNKKGSSGHVLFIGPQRINRPLKPFLELIIADSGNKYNYLITGVKETDFIGYEEVLRKKNVKISFGYTPKKEYLQNIDNANLLILTHNRYFEGRLSGVFCDAVSSRTPVITSSISPITEFFSKYGELGLIVDYDNEEWTKLVLETDFINKKNEYNIAVDKIIEATNPRIISDTIITSMLKLNL
jgi:hypothetical protein